MLCAASSVNCAPCFSLMFLSSDLIICLHFPEFPVRAGEASVGGASQAVAGSTTPADAAAVGSVLRPRNRTLLLHQHRYRGALMETSAQSPREPRPPKQGEQPIRSRNQRPWTNQRRTIMRQSIFKNHFNSSLFIHYIF